MVPQSPYKMKSLTLFTSLMVAASSVLAYPSSHQRTCMIPPAHGDASDNIINTFKKCNKNSRVVFNKNHDYYVEKPMNITGLDNVHISIQGNVTFSDKDMTWWQENMFLLDFQSAGTWWIISGKDIHVDGGGTVNGQGQVWWDAVVSTCMILLKYTLLTRFMLFDVYFRLRIQDQ